MTDFVCSVCGKPAQGVVGKPVLGGDLRHRKCENAEVIFVKQASVQTSAQTALGREKAAARKELTGRYRQGNHDSQTKPTVRGGPKGDRHDNGVRQGGHAGKK